MAGRRKKDSRQKQLEGAKKRPADKPAGEKKVEVMSVAEAPMMPEYFRKSKTLPVLWEAVVSDMDRMNMLARTDAGTVEMYVVNLDRFRRAQEDLIEQGDFYTTKTASGPRMFKHPAIDVINKCITNHKSYAIELGCTPASRTKVPSLMTGDLFAQQEKKKDDNPFSKFN